MHTIYEVFLGWVPGKIRESQHRHRMNPRLLDSLETRIPPRQSHQQIKPKAKKLQRRSIFTDFFEIEV